MGEIDETGRHIGQRLARRREQLREKVEPKIEKVKAKRGRPRLRRDDEFDVEVSED